MRKRSECHSAPINNSWRSESSHRPLDRSCTSVAGLEVVECSPRMLGFRARGPEGPKRLPSRVLGALIGVRRCGYVPSAKDASQHPRGPSRARPVSHARFCRPIPLSRAPFCGTGFPRRTGSARGVQTPVPWSCPHCVLLRVNRGPPQALRQGGGLPLVAGEGGGTVHSNPSPTVGWDGGPRPPFVCRSSQGWVGNAAERPTVIRRPEGRRAEVSPCGCADLRVRVQFIIPSLVPL